MAVEHLFRFLAPVAPERRRRVIVRELGFALVFLVGFLLLMFSKFFPLIPLWEEKEGQKLMDEIQVGRLSVPALVKE